MKTKRVMVVAMVTMVMLLVLGAGLAAADSGAGDPQNGKPINWTSQTFYSAQLTTTGTSYTGSPLTKQGTDVSRITSWSVAEVFVTADVSGTATITVTPQLSNDAVNWTDAYYMYLSNSSTTSTAVVTGTAGMTATTTTVNATTPTQRIYQMTLSADGTSYKRVEMAGDYLRFKIESSATASQTVTATVRTTLKNYQ